MKYSIKQYSGAVLNLIEKSPDKKQKIVRNFITVLRKNRDYKYLELILREAEKQYLKSRGLRKITIETPSPVPEKIKKEAEKIIGKNAVFNELVKPELIAGIKFLIDDEILIDASGRRQIDSLFSFAEYHGRKPVDEGEENPPKL